MADQDENSGSRFDPKADGVHQRLQTTPRQITVNDLATPSLTPEPAATPAEAPKESGFQPAEPAEAPDVTSEPPGVTSEPPGDVTPAPASGSSTGRQADRQGTQEDSAADKPVTAPPAPAVLPVTMPPAKAKGNSRPWLHYFIEAVLLLALIGLAFWALGLKKNLLLVQQKYQSLAGDPFVVRVLKTEELVKKVGQQTQLPADTLPVVQEVTDAQAVVKQVPSLKGIQNGDQILTYSGKNLFVIYRPSSDKIIGQGTLTGGVQAGTVPKQ